MTSLDTEIAPAAVVGKAVPAHPGRPFAKVVVANRGAVAARVIRALKELGVATVAIHSDADAGAPYLATADEVHRVGPASARASYLDQDRILEIALACGADAVHPGYGFLSENAAFARKVEENGLTFIGPSPSWIAAMGEKTRARSMMAEHGLPVAPGSGLLDETTDVVALARRIGFPLLVKPAGGGGGIGMLAATDEDGLVHAVERARALASRTFGNGQIYFERLLERPRHIEFQVLADRSGKVRHLFERDCSLQRRHQKIIEESPAPGIPRHVLEDMGDLVAGILCDLRYDNIGTVEMLRSADGAFSFLEMNTRLQVEHAVTEMVTGIDLVAAQVRLAAGEPLAAVLPACIGLDGHAMEARVYAEDPETFLPAPGVLERFRPPQATARLRIETGYAEGRAITPYYDPMIAKVIVKGDDRGDAIRRLIEALTAFEISGTKTNLPFLLKALRDPRFCAGDVHTGLAGEIAAGR
ncbi:biotin carboxylase N-terminal domain-containing protein [Xanthobacter sp. DSM 24535]|uniref:acetyl-CoA carboxylase biotin carboxylase subunit n=1 Tax=Roseixanthobacter psychrophilus TaxID=3119917 RepID=UPI0037270E67